MKESRGLGQELAVGTWVIFWGTLTSCAFPPVAAIPPFPCAGLSCLNVLTHAHTRRLPPFSSLSQHVMPLVATLDRQTHRHTHKHFSLPWHSKRTEVVT